MFLYSFEFKFLSMENCAKQIAMVKMFYQMGMSHPTLQECQEILSLVSDTSSLDWLFTIILHNTNIWRLSRKAVKVFLTAEQYGNHTFVNV
ncbi:hypothetical protein SLEP1_g19924 [Rubroshorea leprosula]|uniref:Uncharacterized protein n=1 Tax=Rubroshorea leprosula TaxID=152421 RepID=A0AAV5J9V3_9ROSI|nr:hypothetical protein SLEP1_g19924 [Rubroshorea leprosula]